MWQQIESRISSRTLLPLLREEYKLFNRKAVQTVHTARKKDVEMEKWKLHPHTQNRKYPPNTKISLMVTFCLKLYLLGVWINFSMIAEMGPYVFCNGLCCYFPMHWSCPWHQVAALERHHHADPTLCGILFGCRHCGALHHFQLMPDSVTNDAILLM